MLPSLGQDDVASEHANHFGAAVFRVVL